MTDTAQLYYLVTGEALPNSMKRQAGLPNDLDSLPLIEVEEVDTIEVEGVKIPAYLQRIPTDPRRIP